MHVIEAMFVALAGTDCPELVATPVGAAALAMDVSVRPVAVWFPVNVLFAAKPGAPNEW
jgi:hypothetical protein